MSTQKFRPCGKNGCNNLAIYPNRFCESHIDEGTILKQENNRRYDRERKSDREWRFYQSKEWKLVRHQRLILDNYLCQECLKHDVIQVAEMVHHIIPVRQRWDLRLQLSNLKGLCHSCHNKEEHDA